MDCDGDVFMKKMVAGLILGRSVSSAARRRSLSLRLLKRTGVGDGTPHGYWTTREERTHYWALEGLFLFFWLRAFTSDETPRRIVQVAMLATALPVGDVVNQRRTRSVAGYS